MFQFFPNKQQDGGPENCRPIRTGVNAPGKPLAALPLEIQRVEKALRLDPIFEYVGRQLKSLKRKRESEDDWSLKKEQDSIGNHIQNNDDDDEDDDEELSREGRRANRKRMYNLDSLCDSRKWMKDVLLSDVLSSDEDIRDDLDATERSELSSVEKKDAYVRKLLKEHACARRCRRKFQKFSAQDQRKCMYYGSGLVLGSDPFSESPDLQNLSTLNRSIKQEKARRVPKSSETKDKTTGRGMPKIKVEEDLDDFPGEMPVQNFFMDEDLDSNDDLPPSAYSTPLMGLTKRQQQLYNNGVGSTNDSVKSAEMKQKVRPKKAVNPEQMAAKRRKLWTAIAKKDIPRMHKHKSILRKENLAGLRKVARECQRECRKVALASQKQSKEACMKARRLAKEMQAYWKRFEKVEKEHRKKAEKEALEQKKMDMEMKEMLRQQRKLNFLIAQTELYAHFMAGKLSEGGSNQDGSEGRCEEILRRFDEEKPPNNLLNKKFARRVDDDYDSQQMKDLAMNNVRSAIEAQKTRVKEFDAGLKLPISLNSSVEAAIGSAFSDPSINKVGEWKQPNIFRGTLKSYQLKGMNWIANLYDQGINGILADEMGLGKTVQSVAFLAHLAEEQGIWGPFLVVAPASTLHNWLQEMTKFVPDFKVIPYWGTTQDRKVLRKFWNKGINKHDLPTKDSSFHVVITSYQMVVQDAKYFQQINWHYMVLDEAQAIKSSNSSRWKSLLVFKCRNRLLLTGTPIQNSMAELWALLHFIMPTLFDSHEEFSEWFSKDIENHVERQSSIDANQLGRLHMILKPFMLRRVKKDVENELSDKIEVQVCCPLTRRQKLLYKAIKNKISIDDLLQSSSLSVSVTNSLMNIVMQLRKVCNHPELFERMDLKSPCFVHFEPYYMPKLIFREGWLDGLNPDRQHFLADKLSIFDHHSIHRSIFHDCSEGSRTQSSFSFTRFTELSVSELCLIQRGGHVRWLHYLKSLKSRRLTYHQRHITGNIPKKRDSFSRFLLDVNSPTSPESIGSSDVLRELCFVQSVGDTYALCEHTIHFVKESFEHRKMRFKNSPNNDSTCNGLHNSSLAADEDSCPDSQAKSTDDLDSSQEKYIIPVRQPYKRSLVPTSVPSFLLCLNPKVVCKGSTERYTCDRSAEWAKRREFDPAHNRVALDCLNYGSPEVRADWERWNRRVLFSSVPRMGGFIGSAPVPTGYTGISLPNKEMLVTDAGKLTILDGLLTKLKSDNHRVLIYSQMTKMIDILEEFLWHRRHTYMRLDGSSKISERRDMVADFQTRSDIFIFLLSTRAGGLGINLTAADTVIFYDSDWNPTVDQQAMDRAHRLGQTKQVTVYRLVCEGTIEERILQRAKEKSEIQRMVISGGDFAPDILKPKEVVTLLLDDEEMAKRVCQKQEQRRARDELRRDLGLTDSRKRPKSGRGPGRPPKRLHLENKNFTLSSPGPGATSESPAHGTIPSYPPSPTSTEKIGLNNKMHHSESLGDDDTNSSSVFNDFGPKLSDVNQIQVPRKRGRPKGSTSSNSATTSSNSSLVHSRPRGRGSIQKSLSAAEAAALTAAKQAALAAHGYNYSAKKPSSTTSS